MSDGSATIDWVVLTMATRPDEFQRALDSIDAQVVAAGAARSVVVSNGADLTEALADRSVGHVVDLDENVGIPAGRDIGIRACESEVVGLLDDDAELDPDVSQQVLDAFAANPRLGAVALRLNDENGDTSRRHVPRLGGSAVEAGGAATFFVGAAHAIRVEAYHAAGGYFRELWYGHEEIEFSWRLIDAGWDIEYLAHAAAFHPRTEISRHPDGWRLTGRNRVLIARRTLPWAVAVTHVTLWLLLGLWRAPRDCTLAYIQGWLSGWRGDVDRRPIHWKTVVRLTRLGRPPVL